jgi:MIT (microtubule interacting and transport) domain
MDSSPFHSTRQPSNNFNNFAFQGEPPRSRGHAVLSQTPFQNASPPRRPPVIPSSTSPESSRRPPAHAHAHRRSNSLTGMNQGVGNLNRWSKSSVSSAGSTQPAHKRSNSARRVSLSGSTTFLLGADNTSPTRKLQKNRPSTANSPQTQFTRSALDSSLTLPPIVTLPSLQTSVNNSSPLTGPATPSPSTAAILSAAVRTTVPDYFGRAWEESTPRAFAANVDPRAALQLDREINKNLVGERQRSRRGHSRNRDQAGQGSNSTNSNRNSKQPSQKAMLSKALQKANTAVLLDNAQNFEGAMQAYSEACALLQQVMIRSSGDEDRRKLEAIVKPPRFEVIDHFANRCSAILILAESAN